MEVTYAVAEVLNHVSTSDFVQQASRPDANLSALCAQFGISRPTDYKWLRRYRDGGVAGLGEQSRRPHTHLTQTDVALLQRSHPRADRNCAPACTRWTRGSPCPPPAPSPTACVYDVLVNGF